VQKPGRPEKVAQVGPKAESPMQGSNYDAGKWVSIAGKKNLAHERHATEKKKIKKEFRTSSLTKTKKPGVETPWKGDPKIKER